MPMVDWTHEDDNLFRAAPARDVHRGRPHAARGDVDQLLLGAADSARFGLAAGSVGKRAQSLEHLARVERAACIQAARCSIFRHQLPSAAARGRRIGGCGGGRRRDRYGGMPTFATNRALPIQPVHPWPRWCWPASPHRPWYAAACVPRSTGTCAPGCPGTC